MFTGAWIITGGTHAGVMKHVGESVKDFGLTTSSQNPVVVIGIAPWGCIQNRELLINEEVSVGNYTVNVLKSEQFIPYYVGLNFAFLCSSFLKYLVEWQTV